VFTTRFEFVVNINMFYWSLLFANSRSQWRTYYYYYFIIIIIIHAFIMRAHSVVIINESR